MSGFCLLSRVAANGLKAPFWRNQCTYSRSVFSSALPSQSLQSNRDLSVAPDANRKLVASALLLKPIHRTISTSSSHLSSHKGHDHSKLWTFERFLAASLLPLVPAALYNPCQQLDTALALVMVMHTHFGLEAIVVDYIRPIIFGNVAPKVGLGLLYLFSILTLAGLLNLIYNDCGLANTILTMWKH